VSYLHSRVNRSKDVFAVLKLLRFKCPDCAEKIKPPGNATQ